MAVLRDGVAWSHDWYRRYGRVTTLDTARQMSLMIDGVAWAHRWDKQQHARLSRSRPKFDPRPGQVSWVRFFRDFSSPVRQMSGSIRPPRSPNIIWPSLSSITGANDLGCWRALKPQTYILSSWLFTPRSWPGDYIGHCPIDVCHG